MEKTSKQESSSMTELLPKNGLVYSEKANLSEVRRIRPGIFIRSPYLSSPNSQNPTLFISVVLLSTYRELCVQSMRVHFSFGCFVGTTTQVLCKPKLMPIKSITLQKLEQLEEQLLGEKQSDMEHK